MITIQQKLIHKTEFPQYECLYDSLAQAHQHWHCTDEHKLGDKGDVELVACLQPRMGSIEVIIQITKHARLLLL